MPAWNGLYHWRLQRSVSISALLCLVTLAILARRAIISFAVMSRLVSFSVFQATYLDYQGILWANNCVRGFLLAVLILWFGYIEDVSSKSMEWRTSKFHGEVDTNKLCARLYTLEYHHKLIINAPLIRLGQPFRTLPITEVAKLISTLLMTS